MSIVDCPQCAIAARGRVDPPSTPQPVSAAHAPRTRETINRPEVHVPALKDDPDHAPYQPGEGRFRYMTKARVSAATGRLRPANASIAHPSGVIQPEQPRGQRRVGEVMLRGLTEPVKVVTAGDPWWYLVEQPQ
jgi:hypothetical protein